MDIGEGIGRFSVDRHKAVAVAVAVVTVVVALLAALPSIWPGAFPFLNPVAVDTDPENMLPADEPVRIFHNRMKRELALHDMVVVGVVNESHPDGVFNPESLRKIHALAEYAKTLHGANIGAPEGEGVVVKDLIAPSTVDFIEPISGGVKLDWLMRHPPATAEDAREVRRRAMRTPFLKGTVVSEDGNEDGKAVCLYLPVTSKDLSHRIYSRLKRRAADLGGPEEFHITGLPVAEDTFGVEMFIQMAISAPVAMAVIFLLMLLFFRKVLVIVSPMIVALVSVVITMGALVIAGYPIHIMSSMIPIFIMPIAVLDSIHIISEFFERYQATKDRRATILKVMDELFMPMLYTSLTSAAGFASLALTPIPPVQVFGVFVAMGIMAAWALTVTFIPAYLMFIPARRLESFGAAHAAGEGADRSLTGRMLRALGGGTYRFAKPIVALAAVVLILAGVGISFIRINDNPVKWFTRSHPIRRADRVLNEHFGGTYMAYLALGTKDEKFDPTGYAAEFAALAAEKGRELKDDYPGAEAVFAELAEAAKQVAAKVSTRREFFEQLAALAAAKLESATGQTQYAWEDAKTLVDYHEQAREVFKDPVVLNYVADLQKALAEVRSPDGRRIVGKSNSLADIVRTVHRDFRGGEDKHYRIPSGRRGVADMLFAYQQGNRPDDLWHFVTHDYRTSSIWVQLTSGDNKDMSAVVAAVEDFMASRPPPKSLAAPKWFGLTYINVIWQEKMVTGMLKAFAGSFLVVLLLMTILFRSPLWGLLSMIPLTVTIAAIYGVIGAVGKDYDMPVAVLSSLTLGLAIDFAIHFLARGRSMYPALGSWRRTAPAVFGEPARAIARNIVVIAAGFLPLLLAPLVPYKTVGIFLAAILVVSGVGTLLFLPALMRLLERRLFAPRKVLGRACNCGLCGVSSALLVALVALNLHEYTAVGWATLTWIAVAAIVIMALICGVMSRRQRCKETPPREEEGQ